MKNALIFLFTIFHWGCNGNYNSIQGYPEGTKKHFSKFSERIKLQGNEINVGIDFLYPVSIDIYDTLMIIFDPKLDNSLLNFFSIEDYRYLGSIGKKGNGPGEFIGLDYIDYLNENGNILAFDLTRNSITSINIDSALSFKNYIPSTKLTTYNPKLFDFRQISDTTFITSFYGEDPRLFLLNWNLDTLDAFLPYPPLKNTFNLSENELRFKVRGNLYQANMEKYVKRKCIVLSYPFINLIQIVNYEGEKSVINIIGPEDNFPLKYILTRDGYGVLPRESKDGYGALFLTDKYIFALYRGGTDGAPYHRGYGDQIFQFTWEGNPVRKYVLDRNIASFTIDMKNNKLFGLDHFSDNALVVWDLKI